MKTATQWTQLARIVCFPPAGVFQLLTVFLPVYLDFISAMPSEPPGNN